MTTQTPNQVSDFPPSIGRPATGALNTAGYFRLEQLTQVSEAELKKLHGMGPKALSLLRQALERQGLSFLANSFSELAQPAQRALAGAGYTQLEQLTQISEAELGKLHGIGPNALKQLRSALEARGLSFASENG